MEPITYWVPEYAMPELQDNIAKLSRRAVKLGSAPIVLTLSGNSRYETIKRAEQGDYGRKVWVSHDILLLECVLTGESPRLDGWQFAAAIRHDAETGLNILATLPGFDGTLPAKYRTNGALCEHCGYERMRRDTYVVRNDDGRFAQVGRQCLKDFTGHADPHAAARVAEMILEALELCEVSSDEESWGGGGNSYRSFDLSRVVAYSLACIRSYGWVSATEAKDAFGIKVATKAHVADLLCPRPNDAEKTHKWIDENVTAADESLAETICAWVLDQTEASITSDYMWNLFAVATKGRADSKSLGLACSMPGAFNRELARRAERTKAADSQFFGVVKDRALYTLRVVNTNVMEGQYGVTTLVSFVDAAGSRAKWFASGYVEYTIDETYTVVATVKEHTVWKGIRETQLSRVAVATEKDLVKFEKLAVKLALKLRKVAA